MDGAFIKVMTWQESMVFWIFSRFFPQLKPDLLIRKWRRFANLYFHTVSCLFHV